MNAAGRRTIVGPWVHGFPSSAYPAPNIDWLHETVRWFDRWLKGARNGADTEATSYNGAGTDQSIWQRQVGAILGGGDH